MYRNLLLTAVTGFLVATGSAFPNELFERAGCAADNCLRAITTRSSASAECSSFLQKTLSPCPTTVTSTSTSTVVVTVRATTSAPPSKRAVDAALQERAACVTTTTSATALPSYASACSNTSRYSSACSCIGASIQSTTLAPSTSTRTATTTVSSTTTVTQRPTTAPFVIYVGYYYAPTHLSVQTDGSVQAAARGDNRFALDAFGFIFQQDVSPVRYLTVARTGLDEILAVANPPASREIYCTITPNSNYPSGDGDLACAGGNGETVFSFCGPNLFLSAGPPANPNCTVTNLIAVPV